MFYIMIEIRISFQLEEIIPPLYIWMTGCICFTVYCFVQFLDSIISKKGKPIIIAWGYALVGWCVSWIMIASMIK
jgi:hypothetical protein